MSSNSSQTQENYSIYDLESHIKLPSAKRPRHAVPPLNAERWTDLQTAVLTQAMNDNPTWSTQQLITNVPDLRGRSLSSVNGKIARLRKSGKIMPAARKCSQIIPQSHIIGTFLIAFQNCPFHYCFPSKEMPVLFRQAIHR